ncbi:MAG: heavy metal-binding domain-containing protein [Siphonobacter sp.]
MIQKLFKYFFILLVCLLQSCFLPSIPISRKPKYDLDVYWKEEKGPDRSFEIIDQVIIQDEIPLTNTQLKTKGPMTMRGNDSRQKIRLTEELVEKAKQLGANAVLDVKYKYYITASSNGFIMEGTAVRYRGL